MKANELRIGCNYQLENGVLRGRIVTIKNKLDLDVAFDLLESNLIKPIPLTEEWLVRFGFEKDFDGSFMLGIISIFKDKRLKQNVYIYTESTSKYSDGQWVVILDLKLQYVHQLQNLYFALTGEELTIKNEDK